MSTTVNTQDIDKETNPKTQARNKKPKMCKVRAKATGFYGNEIIKAEKEFMMDSKLTNATWVEKI